jgi:hypothetical protein
MEVRSFLSAIYVEYRSKHVVPGDRPAFAKRNEKGKVFPYLAGNVFSPDQNSSTQEKSVCLQTNAQGTRTVVRLLKRMNARLLVFGPETENFKIEQVFF